VLLLVLRLAKLISRIIKVQVTARTLDHNNSKKTSLAVKVSLFKYEMPVKHVMHATHERAIAFLI